MEVSGFQIVERTQFNFRFACSAQMWQRCLCLIAIQALVCESWKVAMLFLNSDISSWWSFSENSLQLNMLTRQSWSVWSSRFWLSVAVAIISYLLIMIMVTISALAGGLDFQQPHADLAILFSENSLLERELKVSEWTRCFQGISSKFFAFGFCQFDKRRFAQVCWISNFCCILFGERRAQCILKSYYFLTTPNLAVMLAESEFIFYCTSVLDLSRIYYHGKVRTARLAGLHTESGVLKSKQRRKTFLIFIFFSANTIVNDVIMHCCNWCWSVCVSCCCHASVLQMMDANEP